MSEYIEERITELEIQVKKLTDMANVSADSNHNIWKAISELKNRVTELARKNTDTDEFVKVVRCIECKYGLFGVCTHHNALFQDAPINPDDYCSRGERK